MRLLADLDRCEGHGMCEALAPELLRVGPDGVVVPSPGPVADADADLAHLAVDSCPVRALLIDP